MKLAFDRVVQRMCAVRDVMCSACLFGHQFRFVLTALRFRLPVRRQFPLTQVCVSAVLCFPRTSGRPHPVSATPAVRWGTFEPCSNYYAGIMWATAATATAMGVQSDVSSCRGAELSKRAIFTFTQVVGEVPRVCVLSCPQKETNGLILS